MSNSLIGKEETVQEDEEKIFQEEEDPRYVVECEECDFDVSAYHRSYAEKLKNLHENHRGHEVSMNSK